MNLTSDHLHRDQYPDAVAALHDALRVVGDLEDLAAARVVVPADDFSFLARRASALLRACLTAHHAVSALPSADPTPGKGSPA